MSAPDEYTQKYMEGGEAIAASRLRMPGWFFALMAVILLFAATAGIFAFAVSGRIAALTPLFFTVPLLTAITLLMSHLRATVMATHVNIQYGLFGPTIPIAAIEQASIEKYEMLRYGGYGIRIARDGTRAYSVPREDCVRIQYRDEKGAVRKLVVTVDDPPSFVRAIESARAATGIRVDPSGAVTSASDRERAAEIAPDGDSAGARTSS
jgi:hypothetical protein